MQSFNSEPANLISEPMYWFSWWQGWTSRGPVLDWVPVSLSPLLSSGLMPLGSGLSGGKPHDQLTKSQ